MLCHNEKALIRSHIIPKSFFVALKDDSNETILVYDKHSSYPKRIPKGFYDDSLLCHECEDKFKAYDQYAKELLLDSEPLFSKDTRFSTPLWYLPKYNYYKLKLFFISLMLRASASHNIYCSKVKLGHLECRAKNMFEILEPGAPEEFSIFLIKYSPDKPKIMIEPYAVILGGIKYFVFNLKNYFAFINVSGYHSSTPFKHLFLEPDKSILVLERSFGDIFNYVKLFDLLSIFERKV